MFTLDLICMQYVCFHNPPNYDSTTYRVFNVLHNLLMTVYTQVFASIYSVSMNSCLFYGGSGGLGPLFFRGGGGWPSIYDEILEATLMYAKTDRGVGWWCDAWSWSIARKHFRRECRFHLEQGTVHIQATNIVLSMI